MNVLTLTRTKGTPHTSSQAQGPLALMEAAHRADPSLRFRWPIVKGYAKYGDLFSGEGVEPVYMLPNSEARMLGFRHDEELLPEIEQADVVLSNQIAQNQLLRRVGTPVVNLQMWGMTPKLTRQLPTSGPEEMYAEVLGTAFGWNVWESTIQKNETLTVLETLLSDEGMKGVDFGTVLPLGVNMAKLDELYARRVDEPAMFWCGEMQMPHKGYEHSSRLMSKISALTGCRAIVSSRLEEYPNPYGLEVHWDTSREEFLGLMSQGSVFLCNCTWESYGLAWLEMLGAGLLGVYKREWWMEYVLPDWYPFLVDTFDEQLEVAIVLIQQYPDGPLWRKYQPAVRDWVREEHSIEMGGSRLADVLERAP